MNKTTYFNKEENRILTAAEAKNYVRWHRKGCVSCSPIKVPTISLPSDEQPPNHISQWQPLTEPQPH